MHLSAMMVSNIPVARREDIRANPAFRAQFHAMCANIGVDPLASNKGLWAQVLPCCCCDVLTPCHSFWGLSLLSRLQGLSGLCWGAVVAQDGLYHYE